MRNTEKKWLIYSIVSMLIAIILFIMSQTILKDVVIVHKELHTDNSVYLSFNTSYAKIGSPLTVSIHNTNFSSEEIQYTWSVDGQVMSNHNSDTYTPTEDDLEKFISVTVTYGDNKKVGASLYCSKLPVIHINTEYKHITTEYSDAYISMQSADGYSKDASDLYFGNASIKLYNNPSTYGHKMPYDILLDESCNLLGMDTGKHWLLLSNHVDPTFLRTKLMQDLSASLEMKYTPKSALVVVIYNGSYNGIYQLCEPVEIDDEQVNIYNFEELAKEAASLIISVKKQTSLISDNTAKLMEEELTYALLCDLSWLSEPYTYTYKNETYDMRKYVDIPSLTGGFLLKLDENVTSTSVKSPIITNYKQPLLVTSPAYASTNKDLNNYIYKFIQTFEYALHSDDFIYHLNEKHYIGIGMYYDWNTGWIARRTLVNYFDSSRDGLHYSDIFDMDSLINNWILCEFSMNYKAMHNDLYIAKDIDGLGYICTLQDYNSSFGNENGSNIDVFYPESWHTTLNYFTNQHYYQSEQWNRYLVKDPYFLLKVYERYKEIRPTVLENIIKPDGYLDYYEKTLMEASFPDSKKWYTASFDNSMIRLRSFIDRRLTWMDKQFASFDTFVNSLGYYTPSNDIEVTSVVKRSDDTYMIIATTTNPYVSNISFQVNGSTVYTGKVNNGVASIVTSKIHNDTTNIVVLHGINSQGDYMSDTTNYELFGGEYGD